MMGMSAVRMGYMGPNQIRALNDGTDILTTPGGPWPRFSQNEDAEYNPSGAPINGVAASTFFDNLVLDAVSIGSALLDAGDPAAVNNLVSGESIITEPSTSSNAQDGGPRVAVNFSGLLLNAPHIHSRYGGSFKGVIIGDVAMLARNPSSSLTLEQFNYDAVFDTTPWFLPALKTTVLQVQP
jgi:hypothetical protein